MDNNNTSSNPNTPAIPETENQNTETAGSANLPSATKPKWYKSKRLLGIVLLVITIGASSLSWALSNKNTPITNQTSPQSSLQTTPDNQQKPLTPFAIAYSYQTQDQSKPQDCLSTRTQLYWRPVTGGDKTNAAEMGNNNSVSHYGVYQNKIFVITEPSCGSKDGTTVWFSSDAGKSYTRVYNKKPAGNNSLSDQITSADFSSDGKTILIAFLPADSSKNTVKELDPDTKKVKDLFTVDSRGVFILGYNRSKQQVFYYKGCYNCDGNSSNKLFAHDIAKSTDAVIFEDTEHFGLQMVLNNDFSKILRLERMNSNFMGGDKPYTIEEFDIANKTSKQLFTSDEDTSLMIGYRDGDGLPYYIKGKNVYSFDPNGSSMTLFEASKPILNVFYISKDQILVSSGEYNNNALTYYTFSSKAAVNILNGDEHTRIFGVTRN